MYFALIDVASHSLLLVHHVKARMWMLPGGHVDDGEDPRACVERETPEELGIPGIHLSLGAGEAFVLSTIPHRTNPLHGGHHPVVRPRLLPHHHAAPRPKGISAIRWARIGYAWTAD